MKTEKEIEDRIRKLEDEQSRQEFDLRDLEEIARLEENLKRVNESAVTAAKKPVTQNKEGVEIERLEHDLEVINQTPVASIPLAQKKTIEPQSFDDDQFTIDLPKTTESTGAKVGYIICLMFNVQKPTEWTEDGGGGWRESGKGFCYATLEQAKTRLEFLRAKWPDYPIELRKRL
ncbi:hypothetical protein [Beggiatoa leptomitoformis]|uniref:Uncharacterized protein n=1 Tax=Beggiatoa leptomitoformis TaxID=288004 RepID=A0A2N9YGF3_9GAMM|nr:hypothetical protein [Beggiatoa leptomitoformis]ALG68226.1 hypothetical protein AL038_11520 [Beggiatoa leptomitoformis]AUI69469.1 hypothetical protein BLE401_12755 [Beggiatoa leptomitoformis]